MFVHTVDTGNNTVLTPCGKWRRLHWWSVLACRKCIRSVQNAHAETIEDNENLRRNNA